MVKWFFFFFLQIQYEETEELAESDDLWSDSLEDMLSSEYSDCMPPTIWNKGVI
jgi:hypothetical protein